MGDQRPGKLSKIGKLLGVSSTNLHKLDNQQQQKQKQQQNKSNGTVKENPQSPSNSLPSSSSSSINLAINNNNNKNNSHDDELILSQIENDQVSPLRDIKQPQPQPQPQPHSTTLSPSNNITNITNNTNNNISNSSITSNNASPKLTSTRSHSPVQNLSSTTTSPLSIQLLDQKLKRQQSSSTSIPQVLQIDPKPLGTSSSSAKPSPSVSRSSSVRKVPLQTTKSTSNTPTIKKPESISSAQNIPPSLPRFLMLEDGNHEHHLRSAKRQEKLSNMLKDLLGAKKLRDEAKSAVPNLLQGAMQSSTSQLQQQQQQQPPPSSSSSQAQSQTGKPPTLFAGLVNHVKNNTSPYHQPGTVLPDNSNNSITGPDCRSFVEKYGRCQEVIGRGSFGVVRISHKRSDSSNNSEKLYAVKEFKRKPTENEKKYNRRLTSEFCISSSLKHINIIHTLDLLKDAKGDYCEVMEFCSGGDLYTLIIAAGKLEYAEADCFFKQLIRGVNYMHEMGITHRDLKPENLLLTQDGVLKITDFGNAECFKMAWENEVSFSQGICGSSPYIAPEEFTQESFDPRAVDIWSTGVIYMAMRTGRQLWLLADPNKDEFFQEYLVKRKDSKGYEPIESLKRARCRNVIYSILDPVADRRITGKQILNSEWGREIKCCVD